MGEGVYGHLWLLLEIRYESYEFHQIKITYLSDIFYLVNHDLACGWFLRHSAKTAVLPRAWSFPGVVPLIMAIPWAFNLGRIGLYLYLDHVQSNDCYCWSIKGLVLLVSASTSDSSVLICLVYYTFWLFKIPSFRIIVPLISLSFILFIPANPAYYLISLHAFVISKLLSVSLPIQLYIIF